MLFILSHSVYHILWDFQPKKFFFYHILGSKNGAAVILQDKLQQDVLYLACRHHVLEIILEAVFEHHLKPVGGPEISLFRRFQQEWPEMDKNNVQGLSDEHIAKYFSGDASNKIVDFALNKIEVIKSSDYIFLYQFTFNCIIILVHA
jgi:hypothetical protein